MSSHACCETNASSKESVHAPLVTYTRGYHVGLTSASLLKSAGSFPSSWLSSPATFGSWGTALLARLFKKIIQTFSYFAMMVLTFCWTAAMLSSCCFFFSILSSSRCCCTFANSRIRSFSSSMRRRSCAFHWRETMTIKHDDKGAKPCGLSSDHTFSSQSFYSTEHSNYRLSCKNVEQRFVKWCSSKSTN